MNALTIPISGGAIALCFISLLAWFVSQKMARWDKHLEDCVGKSIAHAKLEAKVDGIDEKVDDLKAEAVARAAVVQGIDSKIDQMRIVIAQRFGE